MTSSLPQPLLSLFQARPPINYLPPIERKHKPVYTGVANFLSQFEPPPAVPPPKPPKVESKEEKKERLEKEKQEKESQKLAEEISNCKYFFFFSFVLWRGYFTKSNYFL